MAKQPTKKTASKRTRAAAVKKSATKKTTTKKSVVKKAATKKTAAKKATRKTVKKKVAAKAAEQASAKTMVVAKFDAGYGNDLYIRGNGAGLVWDAGIPMKNLTHDEWVWESSDVSTELEFKVLINDKYWSAGANGIVFPGAKVVFEPVF